MTTSASNQYDTLISYPVRSEINQIEPALDVFWPERLFEIFAALTPQERAQAAEHLLAPKKIFWNKELKKFGVSGLNG